MHFTYGFIEMHIYYFLLVMANQAFFKARYRRSDTWGLIFFFPPIHTLDTMALVSF